MHEIETQLHRHSKINAVIKPLVWLIKQDTELRIKSQYMTQLKSKKEKKSHEANSVHKANCHVRAHTHTHTHTHTLYQYHTQN